MQREAVINKADVWNTAVEAVTSLNPHYQFVTGPIIQEENVGPSFALLLLTRGVEPDDITLAHDNARVPYNNVETNRNAFKVSVERGFLKEVGPDTYRITEKGRKAVNRFFSTAQPLIGKIAPLPQEELERLAGYLKRIVAATEAVEVPASKIAMSTSRWTDPGDDAPATTRIDQYLTDLGAYRDDAHMAAFNPLEVPGHEWEALTYVWNEDATTVEALHEQLQFRGFSVEEYQAALDSLVKRGWVAAKDGNYAVTEKGREVREAAEAETDRLFYQGWNVLSEDELLDMNSLLVQLREGVHRLTAQRIQNLFGEIGTTFFSVIAENRENVLRESGYEVSSQWLALYYARCLEPKPLTAEYLRQRNPYPNISVYEEWIQKTLVLGGLAETGKGQYVLTPKGNQMLDKILGTFYEDLSKVESLPGDQLDRLLELLRRVTGKVLENGDSHLADSHKIDPGDKAHRITQIDHILDEMASHRDESHINAWKDLGVSPEAWETLTFIWQDNFTNVEALNEQLTGRRRSVEAYRNALQELVKRGWVTEKKGQYSLNDEGKRVRDEAEVATDEAFYSPFTVLNTADLNQLHNLLTALRNTSKVSYENQVAEARKDLYATLNDIPGKLFKLYGTSLQGVIAEANLNAPGHLAGVQLGELALPDALTEAMILERNPYVNPALWRTRFAELVEKGYLKPEGEGFKLTEAGKQALDKVNALFYSTIQGIGDKLTLNLPRLVELLAKAVKGCADNTELDAPWLRRYERSYPGDQASLMKRFDYLYDELNAFRDDSHIAAWKPSRLSGAAWEAFTFAWRDGVATPAELAEKLPFRGWGVEGYTPAFAELVEKGWAQEADGKFTITDAGKTFREGVEGPTNRNFYAPWAVLNSGEVEELRGLIKQMNDELDALIAQLPPQN